MTTTGGPADRWHNGGFHPEEAFTIPPPSSAPLHLRPATMGLVGAGGVLGAAAREAIEQAWSPAHHGLPAATLTINLVGALLLGLLLDLLSRLGGDAGARRRVRLAVGTGFMGAFTTYSTFAIETDLLVKGGRPATALLYAALTIVGGLVAATAGIALGAGVHARTARALPIDPDQGRDDS